MGFGFNLFCIFILLPVLGILLLAWMFSKKKIFGKTIGVIILGVISLVIVSSALQIFIKKKVLNKEDYYGSYVVDKKYFQGMQANWQYDHFRFEIKDNDSVYFYVTDKDEIKQTYKGTISTVTPYKSAVLVLHMAQPTHHILTTNPTIYRNVWGFELVFNSPKFNNVFFTKGEWDVE